MFTVNKKKLTGSNARNFIQFMCDNFGVVKSDAIDVVAKPETAKKFVVIENDKLEKIITTKLPDIIPMADEDIDDTKIAEWLKLIKNFNYELSLLAPKKSTGSIVRKTIKNPSYVYPIAHSVKDKTFDVRKKTVQRLSNNPWGVELVAICLVAMIAACSIVRLAADEAEEITKVSDSMITWPLVKILAIKDIKPVLSKKDFSQFIIKNSDKIKAASNGHYYSINITAGDLFGQAAGAYEGELNNLLPKTTQEKFDTKLSQASNFYKNVLGKLATEQIKAAEGLKDKLLEIITQ